MKRRSFISMLGIAPLLRMPLWGEDQAASTPQAWGPPVIREARAEHQRVVLSFAPIKEATSYQVRYRSAAGDPTTLEGILVTDYCVHGLKNGTEYWFSVAAVGPQGTTAFSREVAATPTMDMDWATLARAFSGTNPTRSSCPFLSIHGNESDEVLRQFMDLIHRFGFEGVTLHPYDMEGFLEEGMWHRWRAILEQARKLGLVVWQQDDKDYPSGYAGGKIVAQDRKLGRWVVSLPYRKVHRGPEALSLQLKQVLPTPQQLVAVSAFGPGNRVQDLTDRVSAGVLRWDIPEGDWQVFVMGAWQPELDIPQLVRGTIRGYIDPLSPQATDLYIQTIYEATARELGAEFSRHWKGWFIDEPGFYSSGARFGELEHDYPYTPDFAACFEQRYGYSPLPYLPLLWVEHGPQTTRVRHDYMDFVSNEYNRLFLGKIREFCESRGMMMVGHVREDAPHQVGPGTGSDFRSLETFSIGAFDHIYVQWYAPSDDAYWRHSKMASSISHYRQVPLDEALVEHFAVTGWQTGLTEMKAMVDWTTARGLNRIVPTGLDTGEKPTWEFCPEFWLHGANPLARYFPAYQMGVNRETMMIRGGRHVAKALILDPAESDWVGPAEELWRANKSLSQAHFDYDNVSCRVLADPASCRIEGKQFRLGREEYEVVVVPAAEAVPVQVLHRLLDFYEAGGTIIYLGASMRLSYDPEFTHVQVTSDLPIRSTDGRADAEAKDLVARIWGDRASGRGQAFSTTYKDIKDLLYSFKAHDVWIDPNLDMLQYYHRRLAGRDLYFLNNEGEDLHTVVLLRGAKGVPELWDPVTGIILQAPCYEANEEGIRLRLALARYESLFVVPNPTARPQPHLADTDADEVTRTTDGHLVLKKFAAGSVHFRVVEPDGVSVEKQFVTAPRRLTRQTVRQGWERTPIEPNGATYRAKFEWTPRTGVSAELVVTDMSQVIHVKLNGKELGMRFTYPYHFELGPALQAGENQLELEHVERYTFTSKLGTVRIVPYYLFRI